MSRIVISKINMTLDPDSIQDAINTIKDIQLRVKLMLEALCKKLLEEGVNVAKVKLQDLGVSDGPLSNSIRFVYNRQEHVGFITAGEGLLAGGISGGAEGEHSKYPLMSYAVFVEYGTGKYAEGKGGKKKQESKTWSPTLNLSGFEKKEEKTESDDTWIYLNEKDNKFYTTSGQPPKPFMHNTYLDLRYKAKMEAPKLIAEFFPGTGGDDL